MSKNMMKTHSCTDIDENIQFITDYASHHHHVFYMSTLFHVLAFININEAKSIKNKKKNE